VIAALRRLGPRSIQARVALAIVVALVVVFVVIQMLVVGFVQARSRSELEDALRQQATSIARAIDRAGSENAPATARDAERYIGDARMVVSVSGVVVHWNRPVERLEASARAADGASRESRSSAVSRNARAAMSE
jgi:hypothetical protein